MHMAGEARCHGALRCAQVVCHHCGTNLRRNCASERRRSKKDAMHDRYLSRVPADVSIGFHTALQLVVQDGRVDGALQTFPEPGCARFHALLVPCL